MTSERAFAYLSILTRHVNCNLFALNELYIVGLPESLQYLHAFAQGASWHKVESNLNALRELQQSQKVAGFGQDQSIRDYADIHLMMSNLLAGMAKMKRE